MVRVTQWVLMGLMCTIGFGCSTYIGDYEYSPKPAVAELRPVDQPPPPMTQPDGSQPGPAAQQAPQGAQPQGPPAMAMLATIIGVHRADNDLQIPDSVEVRLRLDNNGPDVVVFDPKTLSMSNGELSPFGAVIVHPDAPVTLGAQQTAYLTVYFPFPYQHGVEDTDMQSLQMQWRVVIGNQSVGQSVQFQRVWPYYDHPYYYAPAYAYPVYPVVGVGIGFGGRGHWR